MRYKAYISYCHADQKWAAWLHGALESYRVPKRLAGSQGLYGAVPARPSPIFRDKDDLASAADLSETIKEALADSESLIVVCSPAAAGSRWVNEEIRYFRELGKGDRIYCVIVDGDPQATDPEHACFPKAMLDSEDEGGVEPLAADVRKWADGKLLAKLKLAAGVLGVRLDELRQREQQRRRRLQAVAAFAVIALAGLLVFTFQSRLAEREARLAREAQQASAESMLARFLDQTERLGDVADLDTRKAFSEVLSSYLATLDPRDLTPESRRQLGVALSERGVILRDEGELDQAMELFQSARQTLQLLVDDLQGDAQAMFELSQVEYWIGQVNLDLGRMQQAEVSFKAYAEVSAALHRLEPGNADWTMEVAYAQSNLGNLEKRKLPSDPAFVLQYYRSALEYNEQAARQDSRYEFELADSHADVADAWLGMCNLGKAAEHRLRTVELAAAKFNLNPGSNRLKQDYANALSGLALDYQSAGKVELAVQALQESLDLQKELARDDPNNLQKRWNLVRKAAFQAKFLESAGRSDDSEAMSRWVLADMEELTDEDQGIRIDHAIAYGMFLRDLGHRAYHNDDAASAGLWLNESIDRLLGIASEYPDSKKVLNELALSYFYFWDHNNAMLPDAAATNWLENVRQASNLQSCRDLDIASRQAVIRGSREDAESYVSRLTENGYYEPDFREFCVTFGLCPGQ